jgi:cytochrome c
MNNSFELNKIAAAIFLAGTVAVSIGLVTKAIYDPKTHGEEVKRGYEIEVADAPAEGGAATEEQAVQIAAYFENADAAKGEALTKACLACHGFDSGGAHKVGPNLYNVVGSDIAHHTDYSYSSALSEFPGKWEYQALSEFLEKPKKYVKGTKMAYAGMKKPEDRANVLAYLRTLSATPVPFPAAPAPEALKEPAPEADTAKDAAKTDAKAPDATTTKEGDKTDGAAKEAVKPKDATKKTN